MEFLHIMIFVDDGGGNVLFNNALNTFYLWFMWCRTYGKGPLR